MGTALDGTVGTKRSWYRVSAETGIMPETREADMPGRNTAPARFEIMLDDRPVGRFEMLFAATAPGAAPRVLQPHDLVQAWQHAGQLRSAKVTQTDHNFEIPSRGSPPEGRPPLTIILKRGMGHRPSLEHLGRRGGAVTLSGLGPLGRPIARFRLSQPRLVKIEGPTLNAKGGGDVAIEEIVIACVAVSLRYPP